MLTALLSCALSGLIFFILHVTGAGSFPRPLTAEEERNCLERLKNGDRHARDELIEHNLRLVAHIVKKYYSNTSDQDDLISIGSLGLIKAVHTFRPEAGKLTAYASRCIENEILMFFRSNRKNRNQVLWGESVGKDKDGNEVQLSELLGTDANLVPDTAETNIESNRAMRLMDTVLDAREAEVIRLRYGLLDGEPQTQHQLAEKLGISRSYVSRIEKKALEKLRHALESGMRSK